MQTPGNPLLIDEIKGLIHKKGKITFAEFMEMALYHPGLGYYTSSKSPHPPFRKGGSEGEFSKRDYLTSPCLHPVFGRLLARQIYEMWRVLGRVEGFTPYKSFQDCAGFTVVEAGAGKGELSLEILRTIKGVYPEFYNSIRHVIVEINLLSMEEAKGLFKKEGLFEKVLWGHSIDEMGSGLSGCILSNELIDAFPVHIVTRKDDRLLEVYVTWDERGFLEVLDELSAPDLEGYFETLRIELIEGQRVEVNLKALDFIERVGRTLDKGFLITIDYGLPARLLYSPDRKETLICYYRHTMNDNPYERVGYQDITTHVDFTSLARWGSKVGLEVTGFTNQLYFLMGLGILDEFQPIEDVELKNLDTIRWNQGLKELIMPGMGDTFKVLIQHKGIDKPRLLGFSFKDFQTIL